ncbi:MAG: ABC transporter permease [Planctomycetes bacterium]|nr:ABC transporter permease [Planctomycetota bacterium]
MNLPVILLTIKWMIRDTFRQSLASRLFWVLLGFSFICILFCLSVHIEGGSKKLDSVPGEDPFGLPANDPVVEKLGKEKVQGEGVDVLGSKLYLGFGLFQATAGRDRTDAVRFLQVWLAGAVADTAGIFLVLIWTAGFLPTFLEPNQITVLLAKPVPRWTLVIGKYLGVLGFVFVQVTFFVLGTWLALGVKTGVYDPLYLLTIPISVMHFGIFFSFSVLLAVWTRSTVVCVFGSLLFWVICWGLNFGRHAVEVYQLPGMTPVGRTVLEVSYWTLPKPGDMSLILFDALKASGFSAGVQEFHKLKNEGKFQPELSLMASMLFAVVMLAIAARELETTDY